MFREVFLFVPRISQPDLARMEKQLTTRFGSVAKKFGAGLFDAVKSVGKAGLAGIAAAIGLTVLDKLVNPLQETRDLINDILAKADDTVTNAAQFGTTADKLFRLQQLATATGLDQGALNTMLVKFQSAVAEAQKDPEKDTSVRQFVGSKDIAEAFFVFVKNLKNIQDPAQRTLVQNEVFGEKQTLKSAEFLATDLDALLKKIGGPGGVELRQRIEGAAKLKDLQDLLAAKREGQDFFNKTGEVKRGDVTIQDALDRQKNKQQDLGIDSFDAKAKLSLAAGDVQTSLMKVAEGTTTVANKIVEILTEVKKISVGRGVKGVNSFGDK